MPQKIKKMKPKRQDEEKSASLKVAWTVGAVGLCILLIAGIAIATGGGGGKKGKNLTAQTTPGSTPSTTPSSTPTTKVTIEQVTVPPLSIYRRRNPFEPLVNMDAASAGSTPTGVGASGVATGSRVVRVPEQLRSGANPRPEVISRAVTLDGITKQGDKQLAKITVGEQSFDNIAVGQTFGDHYKLLSIGDDSSATILYGDERFTIFTGQSIYL
jgi:hypothetical protein